MSIVRASWCEGGRSLVAGPWPLVVGHWLVVGSRRELASFAQGQSASVHAPGLGHSGQSQTLWSLVAARRSEGWFGERWSGSGASARKASPRRTGDERMTR